jgi:renalase
MSSYDCLVIGAGMAGLTAARRLQQAGQRVVVLDKGRGVGGRMATRRLAQGKADHGAQYFTARTSEFQEFVRSLEANTVVQKWPFPFSEHPRYVGSEGMSNVAKFMANDLEVCLSEKIVQLRQEANQCVAVSETGKTFLAANVIITSPAPQTLELLSASGLQLPEVHAQALASIVYAPCLAVMVVLKQPVGIVAPGGVKFESGPVAWLADNQQKGISPQQPTLTIHASPAFSKAHLDTSLDEASALLLTHLKDYIPSESIESHQVHRWRYSLVEKTCPQPFLQAHLPFNTFIGGDGFGDLANVEGAFLSGLRMAQALLD